MYETGNSDEFCHNCWDSTVVRDYNIRYTDNTRSHTQRYRNLQKGIGVSTQYNFIDVEILTFSYMHNVFPL